MSNSRIVNTSKTLAATRQIHAAINHYRAGEFECAITLCSAAEGQLPEPPEPCYLFNLLQQAAQQQKISGGEKDDFNFAATWLKHRWGDNEVQIDSALVIFWLNRAISKYCACYGAGTAEMVSMFPWAERLPSRES